MAAYSANSVVDSTKFEMEDTGALAGDYVCVPITVTDNPGMAGFNFELDYDKNKLTPVAMTKGDIVTSGDFISNLTEDNGEELDCVSAYWNDSSDMAEDGTLLTVMFLVNDDVQVGEELIVTLNTAKSDVCNQNLDDVTINSTGATITIVELTDEELEPDEGVTDATYFINDVMMKSEDGTIYDEIPANGDFDLDIDFTCSSEEFVPTTILVAAYEEKGCMMEVKSIEITEDMIADGICNTHIDETTKTIGTLKVFAWDSLNAMHPQSEAFMISNQK